MFEIGMAFTVGILALLVVVPVSLLGVLGCRLFGISIEGSLYHESGLSGPALSWRVLARLHRAVPYILILMGLGYVTGV
jgi:hypothetical protein